jgi:hypothetical protein
MEFGQTKGSVRFLFGASAMGVESSGLSAVIDNANQQVTDPSGNVLQRGVMTIDHDEGRVRVLFGTGGVGKKRLW